MDIETIFFDLDHTLWDFESNANLTLKEAFEYCELQNQISSLDRFITRYKTLNTIYWRMYDNGEVTRDELRIRRITHVFQTFGIEDKKRATNFAEYFKNHGPLKTNLMPYAQEVLAELYGKYKLGVLTNGFIDSQHKKLTSAGIEKYFDTIITSETLGITKPHKTFYKEGLRQSKTPSAERALMIGDDVKNDYLGAKKAGLHALFFDHPINQKKFNPKDLNKVIPEERITSLQQIPSILNKTA